METRRILVLAPHPDDEIVACGIAARRARLAAQFCDLLPVYEFAAYNLAGGRVRSNQFPDRRDGDVTIDLTPDETTLKQRALTGYASERGNLRHVRTARESWRPLPRHGYD